MITLWGRNNSTNVKKVRWVLMSWICLISRSSPGWSLVSIMTRNIWR